MKSAKEFIHSVVYAAESPENYVDKRITIYKNLGRKISIAIPPDPDYIYMVTLFQAKHLNS